MQGLNQLVAKGKVTYLGISNTPAWNVAKANQYARDHGLSPFVYISYSYLFFFTLLLSFSSLSLFLFLILSFSLSFSLVLSFCSLCLNLN